MSIPQNVVCRAGSACCCRFKCARTNIYVLITFSLVAELPSNNYGKSPLIISSKKCLPESAIAEIGRRLEETSRPPPERRGLARSSLLRDRRVKLPLCDGQRARLEGDKKFSLNPAAIFLF